MAATVPLGTIAAGMVFYGESASSLQRALLAGACSTIDVASNLR